MFLISIYGLFSYFVIIFGAEICEEFCNEAFLSSNQEEELDACFRGCRYFTINDLLASRLTLDSQSVCKQDCEEAYPEINKQSACKVGCTSQYNYSVNQYQEESDLDMHLMQWHVQIFQPMMLFRKFYFNPSVDKSSKDESNDDTKSYTIVLQLSDNFVEPGDITNEVEINKNVLKDDKPSVKKYTTNLYKHGRNWLYCVEKNTGVSRWVLLCLFVSAAATSAWMCLQICKSEDNENCKKHTFNDEFVPYDDNHRLFFISKSDEAGPLPEKVPMLA
ncbi:transmembrane protein 59 isoform X1 [Hydra vulgaris]|uniref:transmembrane protein 59 isoform X1 n=1 Tax=Hydra vulgaris TaxID=6087 RepID=UPI001F5F164E|nr:transmembrane protein 59 [Hydra vulgaris]